MRLRSPLALCWTRMNRSWIKPRTSAIALSPKMSVSFVAGPNYPGSLTTKSGAKLGLPDYESLVGGIARSEINSRGLAKTDFSEMKFHRMAEAPLYGLKIGRYDLAVASAEEAKTWTAAK